MTLSNILNKEALSGATDKSEENSVVEKLSFFIKQRERSSIIPSTTIHKKIEVPKSGLDESIQKGITFKEIDDKFVQWIGRVLEINGDIFTARIDPIRQRSTSKIARFNIKKVVVLNGDQMEEGATFYWTVGLFRNAKGFFVKRSEIRFRFPIIPNRKAVDELALIKAQELFDGIGWLE